MRYTSRVTAKYDSPREVIATWIEALCSKSPGRVAQARRDLDTMEARLRAQLDDPQLRRQSQNALKQITLIRQRSARCAL